MLQPSSISISQSLQKLIRIVSAVQLEVDSVA